MPVVECDGMGLHVMEMEMAMEMAMEIGNDGTPLRYIADTTI